MTEVYFENKKTGKRYKVVRFDRTTNEMVLRGEHAEFIEKYDKDRFVEMGYALKQG